MKRIQFKPFLINSIVDGRKTETRRLVGTNTKPRYEIGEIIYIGEKLVKNCNNGVSFEDGKSIPNTAWKWKHDTLSPMFMPSKYARLFLRITDINIVWLQNLSDDDAIAEGIFHNGGGWTWKAADSNNEIYDSPRIAFANLWDSIHGGDESRCWFADPCVFVYKFEVVEKP